MGGPVNLGEPPFPLTPAYSRIMSAPSGPGLPAAVTNSLLSAFQTASGLFSEGLDKSLPGEIVCRAGCFGCCIGLFEISLPEALLVREGFDSLPAQERAEIRSRAEHIVRKTAASFPGNVRTGILDPGRTEEADDAYFDAAADHACPMLELPSGRCRVYAFRPITCRTYGLAWKREGKVIHPSCQLNLAGLPPERQTETGVDLERIDEGLAPCLPLAQERDLPLDCETTLAHVVTGEAFGPSD